MIDETTRETMRARTRAYELLSDLLLRGLEAERLALVRELPGLGEALDPTLSADERAAEHHWLFGLELRPYASVFLDPEGRLGGAVTDDAQGHLSTVGLGPPRTGEPPDHLGHELGFLGGLTEAELGALERSDAGGVRQIRAVARSFLEGHVLWWTPHACLTLERLGSPFWSRVAGLVLAVVTEHREAVVGEAASSLPVLGFRGPSAGASGGAPWIGTKGAAPPPFGLDGPAPDPLSDPSTGLARLARFLTSPPESGIYLGGADIRALGRGERLPVGFGGRSRILTNLLRSAADYGRVDEVVDGLRARVAGDRRGLEGWAGERPWRRRFVEPWFARMEGTLRVLDELERGAG